MIKVAILIDGAFFLKRYRSLNQQKKGFNEYDPVATAKDLREMAWGHINKDKQKDQLYLYRILYYDCHPLTKKVHNPITKKCIDFEKSKYAKFKNDFFNELKKQRKLALRLGVVKDHAGWVLRAEPTKELLSGKKQVEELEENDVYYDMQQKGVDIRIGVDIAALAYKRLVDRIVLISGDSDFVPAAKVARREGIDFVLDPMWNHIDDKLFEHIDGLKTTVNKPPRQT
ncbi:hypothetical protein ES703_98060 [subsurface metagenome]